MEQLNHFMAILRSNEIRKLEAKEVDKRLNDLRLELAKERGNINIGGTVTSPGRIKEIRRTVARIFTIRTEKAKRDDNGQQTSVNHVAPKVKSTAPKQALTEVKGGKK